MGSSYRSDLKCGDMPEWEKPLRAAVATIKEVSRDVFDSACSHGESENAADDGALSSRLDLACELIESELPTSEPDNG